MPGPKPVRHVVEDTPSSGPLPPSDSDAVSPPDVSARLTEWWLDLAAEEAGRVAPKAAEYSAADLDIMGYVLTKWPPIPPVDEGDDVSSASAWGQELACAFYLLGKVARAFGAYAEGRLPSDDCWHDIGVYGRMVQRIRETGGWPE